MHDVMKVQPQGVYVCVCYITCWLMRTTAMSLRLVKLLKVSSMSPTEVSVEGRRMTMKGQMYTHNVCPLL